MIPLLSPAERRAFTIGKSQHSSARKHMMVSHHYLGIHFYPAPRGTSIIIKEITLFSRIRFTKNFIIISVSMSMQAGRAQRALGIDQPMNVQSHRPQGHTGTGDKFLPRLAVDLKFMLKRALDSLTYDTLSLPGRALEELAGALLEFAEDVHNDIGLWNSLEQYNIEFLALHSHSFFNQMRIWDERRSTNIVFNICCGCCIRN